MDAGLVLCQYREARDSGEFVRRVEIRESDQSRYGIPTYLRNSLEVSTEAELLAKALVLNMYAAHFT